MNQAQLNWFTNFIWNIDDEVLCDVYVRGKYRDVNIVGGPEASTLPALPAAPEPLEDNGIADDPKIEEN